MTDWVLIAAFSAALIVGFLLGVLIGREERTELRQDLAYRDSVIDFMFRRHDAGQVSKSELEAARRN